MIYITALGWNSDDKLSVQQPLNPSEQPSNDSNLSIQQPTSQQQHLQQLQLQHLQKPQQPQSQNLSQPPLFQQPQSQQTDVQPQQTSTQQTDLLQANPQSFSEFNKDFSSSKPISFPLLHIQQQTLKIIESFNEKVCNASLQVSFCCG